MKTADMTKRKSGKAASSICDSYIDRKSFSTGVYVGRQNNSRQICRRYSFFGYRGNKCVVNDVYVHVYGCGNGYLYGTEYRSR